MRNRFKLIILVIVLVCSPRVFAQSDITLKNCEKYFTDDFISDGQQYKALLSGDETAEFKATFFEGTKYRVVAGAGKEEGNVIFSIYDQDKRLLFSNANHNNSPYWDFMIEDTISCTIETKLNKSKVNSGFALVLIGFKQEIKKK
ncbi:MAG: hypothetical protein N4A49_08105 [Marinifilaceae bacterium]|nr:hypothetical protein [Marinifilaceae bacterium]